MSSKELIVLVKIQSSFEILEKLRYISGNEELNDLWNNLLDIRNNQIDILKQNDLFSLFNSIKLNNVKDNSSQCENSTRYVENSTRYVENSTNRYVNNVYYHSDK